LGCGLIAFRQCTVFVGEVGEWDVNNPTIFEFFDDVICDEEASICGLLTWDPSGSSAVGVRSGSAGWIDV
jgi:hypothetical protein